MGRPYLAPAVAAGIVLPELWRRREADTHQRSNARRPGPDRVPAAAARPWSTRLSVITALAVTFGIVSGLGGLYASSRWNVAAGASITLTATAILALSTVLSRVVRNRVAASLGSPVVPA